MSEQAWGFAPPPFDPDEALLRLRREWRELGLAEREGAFERRGVKIARARAEPAAVEIARTFPHEVALHDGRPERANHSAVEKSNTFIVL